AVTLDVSSDILNALRPSDENRTAHAQAFQERMQILRANFRCITAACLRRFTLRPGIERNDSMGFCKRLELMTPNIGACAPAGNENEYRSCLGLACFNHTQRDAVAYIHHVRRFCVRLRARSHRAEANDGTQKQNWSKNGEHRSSTNHG